MNDSDIHPWIAELAAGNADAFHPFYEKTADHVYRTVYYLLSNKNEAEDVVSEVYVALLRSLSSYDPDKPFRPWLNGLILNQVNHAKRKSWRGFRLFNRLNAFRARVPWKGPAELALEAEEKKGLLALVNGLSPKLREVVVLRYYQDCSFEEIASTLHIPIGTAKSRHHEALRKLRLKTFSEHAGREVYVHVD
ncbi:sigma-70 family RNA polymerase sigma factor [Paenibacillus arenilitoris]|uniref:Sigma-70 family RNA polymerase sigma factor n=1 Tax=Paenibacillus arenilitoris TaxID=2772299 RepID=A0A927CKU1_9BACL|nr:sigma-70 family RNA polymerase sigma factor [Paenibacillus arenilitoris]MBD2869923.1 sigma-70 family RNA polymerase sigma factor [Paenibacillus arenilitoris]